MSANRFIEPLDVLFTRANHLFGSAAGDSSRALMPPWPSVVAGALRSRMLADAEASVTQLKQADLPAPLDRILGTPACPGEFTLTDLALARRMTGGLDVLRPLPADLVVLAEPDGPVIHRMFAHRLPGGIVTSAGAGQLPILSTASRAKPLSGYRLNGAGWNTYVSGGALDAKAHLVSESALWRTETRLGIALDATRGASADGQLYTSDAVSLATDVGLLASVTGADPVLPSDGLLRLGGDGRGARVSVPEVAEPAEPDWQAIAQTGRFRLVTTTPTLLEAGDRPEDTSEDGVWRFGNARARLVAQAMPRYQVISGWDMHLGRPKPAQRFVPTGAVYWFEDLEGTPEQLRKLTDNGLWSAGRENEAAARRAEGFNRVAIASE